MSETASYPVQRTLLHRLRERLMNLPIPAGYDELTPAQFAYICKVRSTYPHATAESLITFKLLGINWRTPRLLAAFFFALTEQERYIMRQVAAPFMAPGPFQRTLVPELRKGSVHLRAVHNNLLDELEIDRWANADMAFMRFVGRKDQHSPAAVADLRMLTAYLFEPTGSSNKGVMDLVQRFNGPELMAVAAMHSAHRSVYEKQSHEVFSMSGKAKGRGWPAIFHQVAGGQVHLLMEVKRVPARQFLYSMHLNIIADREARIKAAQHK